MKSNHKSKVKKYYFRDTAENLGNSWRTFSSLYQDELEALRNYLPMLPKLPIVALTRQYFLYREYLVTYSPDPGSYNIDRTILISDKDSIEKILNKAKFREFVEKGSNEA